MVPWPRASRLAVGSGWRVRRGRTRHDRAEADLDELWAHIAASRPDAADRLVDALLEGSRKPLRFSSLGQNRDEIGPGLRSFVVSARASMGL